MVLAYAAVPDKAAAVRFSRGDVGEPHRFHAGTAGRGIAECREIQARTAFYAGRGQQGRGSDRGVPLVGWTELAGRLLRSRDTYRIHPVVHLVSDDWSASAADPRVLGHQ